MRDAMSTNSPPEQRDKGGLKQSLNDSFTALTAAIKSTYEIAPLATVIGAGLAAVVIWATLHWTPVMMGTATLLVVAVSLGIFASRGNFGEAMFSLVGGLLTVFAFEWTPARYVAFMAVWTGFAFAAILISSVKLAAKVESIYRMASVRLASNLVDHRTIEQRLRKIGSSTPLKMFGPIESAEVIRVLAFRKLPIDMFSPCLLAIERLSVITKCDNKTIAIFLADFLLSFPQDTAVDASHLCDILYNVIKDVPVPPEDFFTAFESSRRLLISHAIPPLQFLVGLADCLNSGVSPRDVYGELQMRLNVQTQQSSQ